MSINYEKPISKQKWIKWKQKRKLTMIGFIFIGTIEGIDYSVIVATLYLYLKEVIQTPHVKIYYGLIIGVCGISSFISGLFSGRWVDRTRRIRFYLNVVFILQIPGSILYSIPYSALFPLIGRALVGVGDPFVNVCSGEIVRIYTAEEAARALWWFAVTYSFGFIIGPAINLIFKGIHFNIGPLKVTYLNIMGLVMGLLQFLGWIITNFLIHDCSAEIDLKKYLTYHHKTPDDIDDEEGNENSLPGEETSLVEQSNDNYSVTTIKWQQVLKILLTNTDFFLCISSTFFFSYCLYSIDVLLPLLTVVTLGWNIEALTYIIVSSGLFYFIIVMIMSKFCTSPKSVYMCMLWCIVCLIFEFASLFAIGELRRVMQRDILLVCVLLYNWLFGWCTEEALLRIMVANMVPSHVQSFTENLRSGISRMSSIIAALTAPLVISYLPTWSGSLIITTVVVLVTYLIRWRRFVNPVELDFKNYSKL